MALRSATLLVTLAALLGFASAALAVPPDDVPEEPDFAFIAGGPYTQKKNSLQFIAPGIWAWRTSTLGGSQLKRSEFGALLRTEWGFTDRLELDVIFSAAGARDRLNNSTLQSSFAWADSIVGVRYRLLRESSAPLTLTMGPQLIIPTGSRAYDTGFDTPGYAWDIAAAKDWGGPVFVYSSLNYSLFPSVKDPVSSREFNLHNVIWANALGIRALEKPRGTSHHDIHVFLEVALGREEGLGPAGLGSRKVGEVQSVFAPGIRYGVMTRTSKLVEIGVSFPVGLTESTPRAGVIVQIQFESIFGFKPE